MNTDLLLATAAAIDLEPESFNLAKWGEVAPQNLCGSSGCIAGQVTAIVHPQLWQKYIQDQPWLYVRDPEHPARIAMEALGLTEAEARTLFQDSCWWLDVIDALGLTDQYLPDGEGKTPEDLDVGMVDILAYVSPKQASEVLRALARGELDLTPQAIPRCECNFCNSLRMERSLREGGL